MTAFTAVVITILSLTLSALVSRLALGGLLRVARINQKLD